jgi:hypothetical protein
MSAEPVIPTTMPHRWVFIACLAVVGLSVLPLPYVYYIVLRIIIFGSLLWLTLREFGKNNRFFYSGVGFFTALGLILYNPLLPVHLGSKFIWFLLNLVGLYLIRHLITRDLSDSQSDS